MELRAASADGLKRAPATTVGVLGGFFAAENTCQAVQNSIKSVPISELSRPWARRCWKALGATCVAIGLVNAFVPLLPTTVFLIVGAWAYGRGAPELRERLLAHPRYGIALRLWLEDRQISRRGKFVCCAGLAVSFAISAAFLQFRPSVCVWLAAGLGLLAIWIASRPEPAI